MRCFLAVLLFAVPVPFAHPQQPEPPPSADEIKGDVYLTLNGPGHVGPVRGLVFSPDGRFLYSVGADKTIQKWDAKTGERVEVLRVPVGVDETGSLHAVDISPDGKTLALRNWAVWDSKNRKDAHGTIELVNLDTGRVLWLDAKNPGVDTGVAFSPNGNYLVTGNCVWSGLKKIWELDPKKIQELPVFELPPSPTRVDSAFSPDGKRLIYTHRINPSIVPNAIGIWDLKMAQDAVKANRPPVPVAELKGPAIQHITALGWDGRGRPITGDANGTVHIWSADGKHLEQHKLKEHKELTQIAREERPVRITSLAGTSRDEILITGRVAGVTCTAVLNLADRSKSREGIFSPDQAMGKDPVAAITHDGKLAAVSLGPVQNEISIWDPGTGKELHRLGGGVRTPLDVRWSTRDQALSWLVAGKSRSAREGPFFMDFKELHLQEQTAEERDDPKRFRGSLHKSGEFSLEPEKFNDKWSLKINRGFGQHANTEHIAISPTVFTLPPKGDLSWVAWGTSGRLFLSHTSDGKPIHEIIPRQQFVQNLAPSPDGRYFAVTNDAQTIRIYSTKARSPLLHLFQAGDDWIVWTNQGYYAASPGGERLLGWTVNNGYGRLATFHPASRLRSKFYRPDVIERLLDEGQLKVALKKADEAAGRKEGVGVAADPNDLLPPQVTLEATDRSKLPEQVTVKATAEAKTDRQPLSSLQLMLDGRPAPVEKSSVTFDRPLSAGKAMTQEWVVKLPPGKHQLTVLARGKDTFAGSEPVAIEGAAPSRKAEARLHIVAAGVSKYANNGQGDENGNLNLKYAEKDAKEIREVLLTRCADGLLFSPGREKLLRNEEATRKNLEAELKDLASDTSIKSSDLVVFYFSGHGERDESGKLFLLTHETDRRKPLSESCLPGEKLKELLGAIPCRVLLLLDACHSTAVGPKKRPATDDLTRTLIDEDCAVAVMTAAMGKEFALEGMKDEKGNVIDNGLFTQALKEALQSVPATDADGLVFVHEVYQHVFTKVRTWSARKQNPFMALPWSVKPFAVVRRSVPTSSDPK